MPTQINGPLANAGGSLTPTYLQASHNLNFVFGAVNTPEPLPLNTNDEIVNITHSTVSNNSEITVIDTGVYEIAAQPQVLATSAGTFHMWLQINTGGGFVDVPNSNVELTLPNNSADVIPLITTMAINSGTIIRLSGSVTNTGVILETVVPIGEPVVPSIIFSMFRTF